MGRGFIRPENPKWDDFVLVIMSYSQPSSISQNTMNVCKAMYLTMQGSFVHEDHSGSPTPVFCICNSFLLLLELLFTQNKIFCYDIPYALIYYTLAIFCPLLSYPTPKHYFPLLPSSPSPFMHYLYYFNYCC